MKRKLIILTAGLILFNASLAFAESPCSEYTIPQNGISFTSSILDEISGITMSSSNPGLLWGHTDSGGEAELYLLKPNGELVHTYKIRGISNVDWEDIDIGPCSPYDQKNCIYIGDTGDNEFNRDNKRIHAVEEPDLSGGIPTFQSESEELEVLKTWTIHYPSSDQVEQKFINPDCESLMVRPVTGEVYIISKQSSGGEQTLYEMIRGGEQAGQLIQKSSYLFTSTLGSILPLYNAVTGADFSPDGYRFVIRTYASIYEYDLSEYSDIALAFQHPVTLFQNQEIQGEAITYTHDGKSILTAGEKKLGKPAEMHYYECIENADYQEPPAISVPNPLPVMELEPGPLLDSIPEPEPEPDPEPEPEPDPDPDPQPDPAPQPDPDPEPTPLPQPITQPETTYTKSPSESSCSAQIYSGFGSRSTNWIFLLMVGIACCFGRTHIRKS